MNVAFIPVRGGSKSIPLKNIKPICNKPLVYWTVKAATECKNIDKVYVSTDSDIIEKTVNSFEFSKVEVIRRSAKTATDNASTESAMLEFAEQFEFDNIVLIQATSPLLKSSDLDKGFEVFNENGTDSVLSAVKQKRFNWTENGNTATPINYDVYNRPRRQEFDDYFTENGAFYITSKSALIKTRNRVSGNIRICEMSEDSFFEIDEPSDWQIIEALMKKNGIDSKKEIPRIKMFLTDCDGCLTDGGMYYSENGDELKKFCTRDGAGYAKLKGTGIVTGIITGEDVQLNQRRADKMGIDILIGGLTDKLTSVTKISKEYGINFENICYIGDDEIDIECMQKCGFSACPADAMEIVKNNSDYICTKKGGEGVIREVIDMILNSNQNK